MSLFTTQFSVLSLPEFTVLNDAVEQLLHNPMVKRYAELTTLFTPQMHVLSNSTGELHGLLLCMLACLSSYRKSSESTQPVPLIPLVPSPSMNQLPSSVQFVPVVPIVRPAPVYPATSITPVSSVIPVSSSLCLPFETVESSSISRPSMLVARKIRADSRLSWSQVRAIGSDRWPGLFWKMRKQLPCALPACIKHALSKNPVCSQTCRRRFWRRDGGALVRQIDEYERKLQTHKQQSEED